MDKAQTNIWIEIIRLAEIIIPTIITIIVAFISYKLGNRKSRFEKKLDFINKQITEFYSPMMGYINRIRASSLLQSELSEKANEAWKEIVSRGISPVDHEKEFDPFKKLIEYDNKTLNVEILPLYYKMHTIFTENYWLAENSTKEYYVELSRFVDIWKRYQDNSIPYKVIEKLSHTKQSLIPFFEDVKSVLEVLKMNLLEN